MSRIRLILQILILATWFAAASASAAISLKDLPRWEDLALADRLLLTIQHQRELNPINRACFSPALIALHKQLSQLPQDADGYMDADPLRQKEKILKLISATRESKRLNSLCSNRKRTETLASIRWNLPRPPGMSVLCVDQDWKCLASVKNWYRALAPACYEVRQKGSFKAVDNNACFAGDGQLEDALRENNFNALVHPTYLAALLFKAAEGADPESKIDLFEVYRNAPLLKDNSSAQGFFALMGAIATSGNSGMTGWLQGLEDRLLLKSLESKQTPQEIYAAYKHFQLGKILYVKFRELADRKKLNLTLDGRDFNKWNRHNVMAAFLACHSTLPAPLTARLVNSIGSAYESLDFISHLARGMTWEKSAQNYDQDTGRYQLSSQVGLEMCRPLSPTP